MFGFFLKKRVKVVEEEVRKSFDVVKKDFEGVGKWIKHLDSKDKHKHSLLEGLRIDLSTLREDMEELKEVVSMLGVAHENKQLSKKQTPVVKQTAVYAVQDSVQTPVQSANFHGFLHGLSSNERLLVFTLMNSADDMKLSYEDLARLLGKERSTIRGQINSIKQKSDGLLQEYVESSGKKRIYIAKDIKEKLAKYAKVRVKKDKKPRKKVKN
jgi:hypothetical protein